MHHDDAYDDLEEAEDAKLPLDEDEDAEPRT